MRQRQTSTTAIRIASMLGGVLVGAIATRGPAVAIDVAIDLDSRYSTGGVFNPTLPLTTQRGYRSWEQLSALETLTEQGVTFTLYPISSAPLPPFIQSNGTRTRERFSPGMGGGGGPLNDLLTDFVFAEVPPSFYADPNVDEFAGLRLLMTGLSPGEYRMTSWHFDSDVISSANRIRIEFGNPMEPKVVVDDSFPLGTAPATYRFEVTSQGQEKAVDFLATLAGNMSVVNYMARSRLNGFRLLSVPEPASPTILFTALLALAIRRRPRGAADFRAMRSGTLTPVDVR